MKINIDILHIIDNAFRGIATDEEIIFLHDWLSISENRIKFVQYKKEWYKANRRRPSMEQVQKATDAYAMRLNKQIPLLHQLSPRFLYVPLKWAVSILILISIPLIAYRWLNKEDSTVQQEMTPPSPGSFKAQLLTATGRVIELDTITRSEIEISSSTMVSSVNGNIVYRTKQPIAKQVKYNTLIIPRNGEYSITLSDGTHVRLNSASQLRYPEQFTSQTRTVYVEGEAYFDVVTDSLRPFRVITNDAKIRVYGTKFIVNTNLFEGGTETVLLSGAVGICGTAQEQNEQKMEPSDRVLFSEKGVFISKNKVSTLHYTAWLNGYFSFDNQTLEEIGTLLSRWYDIDVFFMNNEAKKLRFSGYMPRYGDIQIILNAVEKMVHVSCEIKGKTLIIR